jgi:bifunctional non-homologous end joining protein LigD
VQSVTIVGGTPTGNPERSGVSDPDGAARLVQTLPEVDQWLYEVKFDGYRALLLKTGRQVQLRSRRDNDLTQDNPQLLG